MTFTDLALLTLAINGVCEIWHHSSLFALLRARTEVMAPFFAELFGCMFCLSVWISTVLVVMYMAAPDSLLRYPTYIFAGARAAQLLNDLTHAYHRTPRGYPTNDDSDSDNPSQ